VITIAATPAEVWRVLVDVAGYPKWWPRSVGLRLLAGGKEALGSELEIKPFGGRPFCCRVEEVCEMTSMRLAYFGGGVEGHGEWRIERVAQGTRVGYRLDVVAHGRLVRWIGKVVDLGGVHSRSMQGVLRNLERTVRNARG
jgi:ribosome-associated toxin RatA of RatAB toxin-antitoxin module